MSSRVLIYCLIVFISTTNCVDPYDFKPKEAGEYLVIDGRITQSDDINPLKLTMSTTYATSTNARPVENAQIKLVDSNGASELYIEEGDGIYIHCGNSLQVHVGGTYHLEIEIGNKKYQSIPQTLPEPVQADSITFKVGYGSEVNEYGNEVSFENIDIFINTPINVNGIKSYLRWKSEESWSFTEIKCHPLHNPKTCYMARDLSTEDIYTFSSDAISGTYLSNHLVAKKRILNNVEFIETHFFIVNQYTLQEEAYAYWDKVIQIANPSGNIFDLPPAPLSGNVYNVNNEDEVVLGYFEIVGNSTTRIPLYQPDIKPITITSKDYLCRWGDYVDVCCNCLNLDLSTTERPDYW
jgi:hypothetical protein